jgi:probable F420-dependent oxidoreductase
MVLPQRHPLILAKEAATLDRLSRGRLELGIGIGWMREEGEALGIPFSERGARTDENIQVMRTLWTHPRPDINGLFTQVEQAASYPKPAQPGGPPIHIGGSSPHAAKRAGRIGDGFYPVVATPAELRELRSLMRATALIHDRDPDEIETTVGYFGLLGDLSNAYDEVRRLEEAGADRIVLYRFQDLDLDTLKLSFENFSHTVIARYEAHAETAAP